MTTVLIPTKPDDTHALYVSLALEKKGHQAVIWYTADFPQQQTQTFKLNNHEITWDFQGVNFAIHSQQKFDVVWVRRPRKPVHADCIHPDDHDNARNELYTFFKNIWQVMAPDAFWINPIEKSASANAKLRQLSAASAVGLNIPKTLVSNHPDEIKAFIGAHPENTVIYKTLCPVYWVDPADNSLRLTYTKTVNLHHLPADPVLQNAPGIFQQKIAKAFELRVTYFGEYAIAAKLHSQEHPKGMMDWRAVPHKELIIEPFLLPDAIQERCKALMKTLGIVFGCFDFIVTPDGDYYFLEVNEQGQFLWIEDANPQIKMLDTFTEFLIHGASDFRGPTSADVVSMADFRHQMLSLHHHAINAHIDPGVLG